MNMCSVRQRPMPCAPSSRALRASSGVSAFAQTSMRRSSSAHDEKRRQPLRQLRRRRNQRKLADGDVARRAVDRDPIAFAAARRRRGSPLVAAVDLQRVAAGNARFAHAARDDRGVRRRAALRGQNAFGRDHAVHVVGRRLGAHEDDVLRPALSTSTASSAREDDLRPAAAPGEALRPFAATSMRLRSDRCARGRADRATARRRMPTAVPLVDQPFVDEIERDLARPPRRCAWRCASAACRACRARP